MTADSPELPPSSVSAGKAVAPYRIWSIHAPFRKDGWPVMGTFGASLRPVVMMEYLTWKRLCDEHPALATAQFEVGEYSDD